MNETKLRRRRVLAGVVAGAVVSGLCPSLPPHWQLACKFATLIAHSLVAP